jgi:hypothetical protein
MVLHRCRLGGPSELETVVFSSATQPWPTHTLARCLPDHDAPVGPPTPSEAAGARAAGYSAPLPRMALRVGAAASRASFDALAGLQRRGSGGSGGSGGGGGGQPAAGGSNGGGLSASSSLASSAWLTSLASEQALMDCAGLWVGNDRPEPAVRGGTRKGSGCALARPRSYPATLSAVGFPAAGHARAQPEGGSRDGGVAAAVSAPLHPEPRLRHAASAPSAAAPTSGAPGGDLAAMGCPAAAPPGPTAPTPPAPAPPSLPAHPVALPLALTDSGMPGGSEAGSLGTLNLESLLLGPLTPAIPINGGSSLSIHRDSMDSIASGVASSAAGGEGDIVMHGGESQAESRERCVHNGRRRNSGLTVRVLVAGWRLWRRKGASGAESCANPQSWNCVAAHGVHGL